MSSVPEKSNYSISNLTVAGLEALITKIVQKLIREESQKKSEQEKLGESQVIYEQTPRPYGLWQGKVQMSDDFDINFLNPK